MRRPASDINSKQREILKFITVSLKTKYRCPSVREICAHMGLSSTSTVQSHLNALEKFGYITRDPNKNRSITVVGMEGHSASPAAPAEPVVESYEPMHREVTSSQDITILESKVKLVPLIGTVQAGSPVTAEENKEDEFILPTSLLGSSDCFLLRVRGESMRDIGMYEGDMLIALYSYLDL